MTHGRNETEEPAQPRPVDAAAQDQALAERESRASLAEGSADHQGAPTPDHESAYGTQSDQGAAQPGPGKKQADD